MSEAVQLHQCFEQGYFQAHKIAQWAQSRGLATYKPLRVHNRVLNPDRVRQPSRQFRIDCAIGRAISAAQRAFFLGFFYEN